MIGVLTNPSPAVEFVLAVLVFVVLGVLKTLMGSKTNEEQWKWAKGKYEIAIVTAVGTLASLFTLGVGADLSSVVFGAAVLASGVLIREAMEIGESSYEHYKELTERGVDREEAAFLGLQHGLENGDIEEVRETIAVLLETAGYLPSEERARERSEQVGDAYQSGGARGVYEDVMGPDDMIEIEDDFDPDGQPPESELEEGLAEMADQGGPVPHPDSGSDSDDDPDEGPVVIDRGE